MIREQTVRRQRRGAAALLAVFVCLAPATSALAQSAYASFEDGNRLFRDDLYWAALMRYREAVEAGMDTALLHFNTGVAHYKAGQHIRARQSLLRAAQDPSLRLISQYNLGLNAYAAGNVEEALDWFRQVRDQEQNEKLREFALIAISRLSVEKRESDPVLVAEQERRKELRSPATFEIFARVGFGNDDKS